MRAAIAALLILASCSKDDKAQPAPSGPPAPTESTCCPTSAPSLISPANNATITAPILWKWTKVPGTHHYAIEALCDWTGPLGQSYHATLLTTTTADTTYLQSNLPTIPVSWHGATGQWRVVALGDDNVPGPWSAYRSFTIE